MLPLIRCGVDFDIQGNMREGQYALLGNRSSCVSKIPDREAEVVLDARGVPCLAPDGEAATLEHGLGEVLPGLVLTSTEEAQQEQEEVEEIKVECERA